MTEGFSKIERIKKKKDFDSLFKTGFFLKDARNYYCVYKKNDFGFLRIGIVIKKKIGCAVKRNYEKRILREFFRKYSDRSNLSFDVIIILKKTSSSFQQKQNDFKTMLRQIQEKQN